MTERLFVSALHWNPEMEDVTCLLTPFESRQVLHSIGFDWILKLSLRHLLGQLGSPEQGKSRKSQQIHFGHELKDHGVSTVGLHQSSMIRCFDPG